MPVSALKNRLYAAALPAFGKRCRWQTGTASGGSPETLNALERVWKRHHTIGGCVCVLRAGVPAETYAAGYARLSPLLPAGADTVFRTASVAKAVCALLVMRLQTRGLLSVEEDISAFWRRPIRNPYHPQTPIPLGALLSHTAGIADSPLYFRALSQPIAADALLADAASFTPHPPYRQFLYSNFAAGLIGSLLEYRFHASFEELMQTELFRPLNVEATFDITMADPQRLADCIRVLPARRGPAFDSLRRYREAAPVGAPDPQRHFTLASGNLYVTAGNLAKLCGMMIHGTHEGKAFLDEQALHNLRFPDADTRPVPGMRHGMGLFSLWEETVLPRRVFGHQGFAYGAVNGFFFDEQGNGFASLTSGASEGRMGRLSLLNRDLIRVLLGEDRG